LLGPTKPDTSESNPPSTLYTYDENIFVDVYHFWESRTNTLGNVHLSVNFITEAPSDMPTLLTSLSCFLYLLAIYTYLDDRLEEMCKMQNTLGIEKFPLKQGTSIHTATCSPCTAKKKAHILKSGSLPTLSIICQFQLLLSLASCISNLWNMDSLIYSMGFHSFPS